MPEGDTIYRAAATLHRALAGKPVVRFESVFPALTRIHEDHPFTRATIERVSSVGKHLLMHFSNGYVLRTHMRMNGSWHIYRPGERWHRPARDMRVLVATADFEAVGFNIPVAEFVSQERIGKHKELSKLGPDVLAETFDRAGALARLRARPQTSIADALLNQRILAGLGNVYKSEVLFACRISPFTPVSALSDEQLACLVDTAQTYLRTNVTSTLAPMTTYTAYRRTTRRADPGERLRVYGRARLPCRRCGTAIESRKQGTDARLTYWCPTCQPS
ncbi:MAG TPA: DNA-formamidopyrimidine glycosylase family protein [Vicinamibacterales bacterium]|nr:DNA-formamidopyrimidine glycosylase family protein [Vicinamibacterales bacterium]